MTFDRSSYEAAIRKAYTSIADSVMAQQDRLGWYHEDTVDEFVLTHAEGIREIISEAPTAAEAEEMVEAVGLRMAEMYEIYGQAHIDEAVRYAKDLKDRYSVLWIYDLFYT